MAPAPSGNRQAPPRQPRRQTRRWPVAAAIGGTVLLAAIVVTVLFYQRGGSQTRAESNPSPRPAEGQTVAGIRCERAEQALFHIHAHLAVFAGGQPRRVPYGIGIPDAVGQQTPEGPFVTQGSCFYWLHSHTEDGVIHVESPVQRTFTLGDYFDVWGQPLSSSRVATDSGPVIAYVNGQRYGGDPRAIPLTAHAVIQLDVGTDVPPAPYTFQPGL